MFLSSQDWAQSQKHLNTYQDKFLPSESTKGQSQNKKRKTINCICSADYPAAIAPAIAKPSAADFPRPRAASKATVLRRVLSKIASRNVMTALPYVKHKDMISNHKQSIIEIIVIHTGRIKNIDTCQSFSTWSRVLHFLIKGPTGKSSHSCSFKSFKSRSASESPSESFNHQTEDKEKSYIKAQEHLKVKNQWTNTRQNSPWLTNTIRKLHFNSHNYKACSKILYTSQEIICG